MLLQFDDFQKYVGAIVKLRKKTEFYDSRRKVLLSEITLISQMKKKTKPLQFHNLTAGGHFNVTKN